jgi:uncharacterized repeat protein (TIGR02543 family)
MKIIKILVAALFVFAFSVQGSVKVVAGMSCDTVATDAGTGHYLVTTANDLMAMGCNIAAGDADYRTGTYDLQNNIDLTGVYWVPIGNAIYPFTGEFNGNSHVLSHLTLTTLTTHLETYNGFIMYATGMFGNVEGADIHDLTIQNASIDVASNPLTEGHTQLLDLSFIGVLSGAADLSTTIDSVTVKDASIDVTNTSMMEPTSYSWPFTYVGGIVGRLAGISYISHSEFTGTISVSVAQEDDQSVYLGGLAGGVESSSLDSSWLDADITFSSPADYEFKELALGGFAGYAFNSDLTDLVAETSLIDVNSDTILAAIGGIAGTVDTITTVQASTYIGTIDSTTDNVGGLIGFVQANTTVPNGSVTEITEAAQIKTNYVLADITGHNHVGGLVGKIYYATDIENSWFEGDIVGHHMVGGLVGSSEECHVTYGISFSLGTLTGVNYLGGITGYGYSENDLMDVFSRMAITKIAETETIPTPALSYYAGGIFGWDLGSYSYYEDVYFAGTIHNSSTDTLVYDPISYFANAPTVGTGVYYDHDLLGIPSQIGIARTTAEMKLQSGYDGFIFIDLWFMDARFNSGYAFFDAGFFKVIFDDGIKQFGYLSRPMLMIAPPTAPVKTGFVFGGWFTDQQLTHAWNFSSDFIEGDVTLYAKWTEQIPDTGDVAAYGFGTMGLGLILLTLSRKRKH